MMKNYEPNYESKMNHKPDRPYITDHLYIILTLIELGYLREVLSGGGGQFDPYFIYQEELI